MFFSNSLSNITLNYFRLVDEVVSVEWLVEVYYFQVVISHLLLQFFLLISLLTSNFLVIEERPADFFYHEFVLEFCF